MKVPALVGAAALILLPSLALAFGCSGRGNQAQSCAAGTVWDHSLKKCVKQLSS